MKPKVLLLDDEAAVGRALSRVLLAAGFDPIAVAEPEQAREALATGKIAVIVSDERMPTISGVEFLEECARQHPGVQRILLTGYADAQTAAEAVNRAEIFKLLFKPWTDGEFVTAVREAAWRHSLLAEDELGPDEETTKEGPAAPDSDE